MVRASNAHKTTHKPITQMHAHTGRERGWVVIGLLRAAIIVHSERRKSRCKFLNIESFVNSSHFFLWFCSMVF